MPNILVVIDPDESEHSALNRIKEIPPTADVDYTVVLYMSAEPAMAGKADTAALKARKDAKIAWLQDLVAPLKAVGYRIHAETVIFDRLYEEIIKTAQAIKADFILKPLRQHSILKRVFYTSTDWNLIRLCPTPLIMVSDQPAIHGKAIVASIDVCDGDKAHKDLNTVVMDQATRLARVLNAPIHLIYAYSRLIIANPVPSADPLAYQIMRDKYASEHAAVMAVATLYDIHEDHVHMREGAPDDVVTAYAEEVDAGVVVLGTVARAGASGLFMGNTAESIVEKTKKDVFVVKQAGFTTPV
jgi:universal stress protein E